MSSVVELAPRKPAPAERGIHHLLRQRWSPHAFQDRPVPTETLAKLLEAARWAPSSFNEQPWRFVVGDRSEDPDTHETILGTLAEGNQAWARQAPVLALTIAKRTFDMNGEENPHARHDVGLAMGQLTVQATAEGLGVHQMGGFDPEAAREAFGIPDAFEPVAAVAIGYPDTPDGLPDELVDREQAPRERLTLDEIAFRDWEEPLEL